jgi:lipoprotein NlpD
MTIRCLKLIAVALCVLSAGCAGPDIKAPVGRAPDNSQARTPQTVRNSTSSVSHKRISIDAPSANVHTVRRGETLYAIAWRYGIDFRTLGRANRIRAPYVIYPGQKLTLKATASAVAKPRTSASKSPKRVATTVPKSASRSVSKATKTVSAAPVKGWSWPTDGQILRRFAQSDNAGVDFAGTEGQAVLAAASGEVVYSGSGLRGYGQLIIVKHNKKFLSAYAHNKKLHVAEGDKVVRGQRIADMGSTGAERVKLHFEIRRNGKPVDPFGYLPRKPGRR